MVARLEEHNDWTNVVGHGLSKAGRALDGLGKEGSWTGFDSTWKS